VQALQRFFFFSFSRKMSSFVAVNQPPAAPAGVAVDNSRQAAQADLVAAAAADISAAPPLPPRRSGRVRRPSVNANVAAVAAPPGPPADNPCLACASLLARKGGHTKPCRRGPPQKNRRPSKQCAHCQHVRKGCKASKYTSFSPSPFLFLTLLFF